LYVNALDEAEKKGITTNSYRDLGKNKKTTTKKSTSKGAKTSRTKKGATPDDSSATQGKKRKRLNKISNYGTLSNGKAE
jgi:hypothetical protein